MWVFDQWKKFKNWFWWLLITTNKKRISFRLPMWELIFVTEYIYVKSTEKQTHKIRASPALQKPHFVLSSSSYPPLKLVSILILISNNID